MSEEDDLDNSEGGEESEAEIPPHIKELASFFKRNAVDVANLPDEQLSELIRKRADYIHTVSYHNFAIRLAEETGQPLDIVLLCLEEEHNRLKVIAQHLAQGTWEPAELYSELQDASIEATVKVAEQYRETWERVYLAREKRRKIECLAQLYADKKDADVILFDGPVCYGQEQILLDAILGVDPQKRRSVMRENEKAGANVLLVLMTPGGVPGVAYRIARLLQDKYERFEVFVPSWCKSAGTLIALGATEIIMSDLGELGPLDVQIIPKDATLEHVSSAVILSTLEVLQKKCYETFRLYLHDLTSGSAGNVTLKTALEVATQFSAELYKPIFAQIEPGHIGDMHRNMNMTLEYGKRLAEIGENTKDVDGVVRHLVYGYPYHGFVIDRQEASRLFRAVSRPQKKDQDNDSVYKLERLLSDTTIDAGFGSNGRSLGITMLARPLQPSDPEDSSQG